MAITALGPYTPTDRQPNAIAASGLAALEVNNTASGYTLQVLAGPDRRADVPPGQDVVFTGLQNITDLPGWVLIIPILQPTPTALHPRVLPVPAPSYSVTTYSSVSDALPASFTAGTFRPVTPYRPELTLPDALAGKAVFNVRDYGAVGDSTTDDTSALQGAITAAGTAGGVVSIPPGQFNVSGTLTVPANVSVVGAGPGATTIFTTSTTLDVIVLNGIHTSVERLHIAATAATRTAGAGINCAAQVYDYRIDACNFDNMWEAIHLGNGTLVPNQIKITNCRIWNTTNAAINSQSGTNIYVTNTTFSNDIGVANTYGFLMTGQNSVFMSNVVAFRQGTGFAIIPAGANILQFGWFVNCISDTITTRCWNIDAGATGTVEQFYFVNCWGASAGTNEGFQITNSGGTVKDILLDNFQAFNNGGNGIVVAGGANTTGVDIRGARCAGNSAVSHNTNFGIFIRAAVSSFSITGSRIGAFAGFGSIQSVGIDIEAGASNNYTIANNDVTGNTNGSVIDGGTGTSKVIVGNIGYNPIGQVTAPAFPATTVAATNGTGSYVEAYIANGTSAITVIQIAGQAGTYVTTGLQIAASSWGVVRLPPNGSVKFTYAAGTPTWTWFGD